MIVGLLKDVAAHAAVLPEPVVRAIEALRGVDLFALAPGRYDLQGDDLFYVVQTPTLRAAEEVKAEAHQFYADIQMPLDSREGYGFALPDAGLQPSEPPVEGHDVAFYPTPADEVMLTLAPGAFIVFLPGELHRSCMSADQRTPFRKVVVKVHAKLLGL